MAIHQDSNWIGETVGRSGSLGGRSFGAKRADAWKMGTYLEINHVLLTSWILGLDTSRSLVKPTTSPKTVSWAQGTDDRFSARMAISGSIGVPDFRWTHIGLLKHHYCWFKSAFLLAPSQFIFSFHKFFGQFFAAQSCWFNPPILVGSNHAFQARIILSDIFVDRIPMFVDKIIPMFG